ncbi:MAG: D-erythronate dehydrogenase [Alphaproteobacteria bacterium]
MKIVITGGAGMLGRKLAERLLAMGEATGPDGRKAKIDRLVLFDTVVPDDLFAADARVVRQAGDIADSATVSRLIDGATDSVFHFAAVVSGGAEADFDLGWRVNLDGGRLVLEAARAGGRRPRVLFTSSLAVYGGEVAIDDRTPLTPQTSYGAQKAIGELMVNDYTRKGFVDGRSVRLPTIVVRPGAPNRAASGFASSILREPLTGKRAVCPVHPQTRMLILTPRNAVEAFIHLHELDGAALGPNRAVQLNGISPSMEELAAGLGRAAGEGAAARIDWQPDAAIQKIVDSWPQFADCERARRLGFPVDASVDAVIAAFVEDDLGGRIAR